MFSFDWIILVFEIFEHGGDVAISDQRNGAIEDAAQTIDDVGLHPASLGDRASLRQIVFERGSRPLQRQELARNHPGTADAKLRRTAAAGGQRIEQQFRLDAQFEPERNRLRRAGDIQRDQNVVRELDLGRAAERPEIKTDVANSLDRGRDPIDRLARTGEEYIGLARRNHARRARNLSIEENRALRRQRRNKGFIGRHRVRAHFDNDLTFARTLQ